MPWQRSRATPAIAHAEKKLLARGRHQQTAVRHRDAACRIAVPFQAEKDEGRGKGGGFGKENRAGAGRYSSKCLRMQAVGKDLPDRHGGAANCRSSCFTITPFGWRYVMGKEEGSENHEQGVAEAIEGLHGASLLWNRVRWQTSCCLQGRPYSFIPFYLCRGRPPCLPSFAYTLSIEGEGGRSPVRGERDGRSCTISESCCPLRKRKVLQ